MVTLIKFDWAIKRLLRQKANFSILEGFISEVLREEIAIEQILESEGNQETEEDKFNRVDILAQNSRGQLIIIEVQNSRQQDYFHRMLYGVSKTTIEHLSLGQKYGDIKKVYSINVVYFDLGQGKDYVYHGKTEFIGLHNHDVLSLSEAQKESFNTQQVFEIFPEYYVLKVNAFNDIAKDSLDEWIYYLKNNQVKDGFKAKGLEEVKERLRVDSLSDTEREAYYRHVENDRLALSLLHTAKMEGEAKGEAKGLADGERNKANKIALKMIARGESDEAIAELTELSLAEIALLRKQQDQ